MIIMALDHTRDFHHAAAMLFSPDDVARTTPAIFLTRWITHFCAPVFMLTAGAAVYLWQQNGHTRAETTRFLASRGLWLIVVELIAMRFALNFSLTQGIVLLNVLWALGWSMIVLGALIYLPARVLVPACLAVIALHNLLDPLTQAQMGPLWPFLHQVGLPFPGLPLLVAYPLIPWFAVMALGYTLGQIFEWDQARRRRFLIRTGLALTVAFLVVRMLNVYGDPVRWTSEFPGKTWISFLRVTKYPPSLDFLLMTLGPALLVLAWFDRKNWSLSHPFIVFGRTPLFYFIGHLLVGHLLAFPLAWFRYGHVGFLLNLLPTLGGQRELYPADYGYSLGQVYLIWMAVVVLMYPACRWFAAVKQRRRDWWLSYL